MIGSTVLLSRPATSDCWRQMSALDGTRPSTRDGDLPNLIAERTNA